MQEKQQPEIIRKPSEELTEASREKSTKIEDYLRQHEKPEDFQLTKQEEERLAKLVEAKKHIAEITDAEEANQEKSTVGLKIHDWVNAQDLVFSLRDVESPDENGIFDADYTRSIVKRNRREAAVKAGLL